MALLGTLRRQILAGALLVLGVLVIGLLIWVIYLDNKITEQFEGRRWTLPAQVFAEPLELYAGQSFGADGLEQELKRLGYERVPTAEKPGSYSRRGNRIDLVNRRFRFWDALQESQLITVNARGSTIASMENGRRRKCRCSASIRCSSAASFRSTARIGSSSSPTKSRRSCPRR